MSKVTKKLTLAEKLLEVQRSIGTIEKKGYNSFQRYAFAREADIAEAFQKLFNNHGIIMNTEAMNVLGVTAIGDKGQQLTTVSIKLKLINTENNADYYCYEGIGQGTDNGDKGVYKAITGAMKYVLLKNFLVPTNDDPENDSIATKGKGKASKVTSIPAGGDF